MTNNAVQKFTKNFGCFEDANQLSYEAVEGILKDKIDISFKDQIIPQIKEIVKLTMKSVTDKLVADNCNWSCFELFGYDLMVDVN